MEESDNLQFLEEKVGKKNAKKIITLIKNFEDQTNKFSKEINEILNPINHETRVQVAFLEKKDNK